MKHLIFKYVLLVACRLYNPNNDVDFTSWFIMCCPIMLINLILCWLSLVFLFIGYRYVQVWHGAVMIVMASMSEMHQK